jgi:hypothetical protein
VNPWLPPNRNEAEVPEYLSLALEPVFEIVQFKKNGESEGDLSDNIG